MAEMKDSVQANVIQPLVANLNGYFWLGLTDTQNEGVFVWSSSQSNATWLNWKTYEPDGGTGQNCVVATNLTRWGDMPCSRTDIFVLCQPCKKIVFPYFDITDTVYLFVAFHLTCIVLYCNFYLILINIICYSFRHGFFVCQFDMVTGYI